MKIQEVLEKTTQFFRQKGLDTPRLDAELLVAAGLGLQRIDLYLKFDQPLSEQETQACREMVRRRASGEPVAYILKTKGFFGFDFFVDPRVLIPRPETELLVELALDFLKTRSPQAEVVDFGAGSGCIGFSILKKLPGTHVTLVEFSSAAAEVIAVNAERLSLTEGWTLVSSKVQDFQIEKPVDLIVANPPYIAPEDPDVQDSVRKFEPGTALFASDHGLAEYKAWIPVASRSLQTGGKALFEIGSKQAESVSELFHAQGFENIKVHKDLAGLPRVVEATK